MNRLLHVVPAIALTITSACSESSTASSNDLPPDTFVNGSEGQVWWSNPSIPPSTYNVRGQFTAATAWLDIVDDQRVQDNSTVEIDYLRVYATVNGRDTLISYDEYGDGVIAGGLYSRAPWFGSQVDQLKPHAIVGNGTATLPLEQCSTCVWHVWVEDYPRPVLPSGTSRVWVATRFRITGKAVLQLGFDYNRNASDLGCDINLDGVQDVGMCEAGKSRWTFPVVENDGWQTLTLGK